MKCANCTAEQLEGRAFETSELCDGPVDGELYRNGDFVVSFQGICQAVIAARIINNEYKPRDLVMRPASETNATVIDLTETEVELPRTA